MKNVVIRVVILMMLMLGCFATPAQAEELNKVVVNTDAMSNYTLEAGDKISILVFREPELSLQTKLTDAGTIIYPFLGEINVAGRTVGQLKEIITKALDGVYLVDPKISVQVLEYREYFVSGEVKKPGSFSYIPGLTVQKAIAIAGWFTEFAPQTGAKLLRAKDSAKSTVDVTLNTLVAPGDTVIVPKYQDFYVNGEVKKPGSFTYVPQLNVQKAIAIAGGFTERASRYKVKMIRANTTDNKEEVVEDLNAQVGPGDVVIIDESFF
jgi:polysaccharide export outer membrane protein